MIALKKWIIIGAIALSLMGALGAMTKMWWNERTEKLRHESNYKAATTEAIYYKSESGKNATKIQSLELEKKEFKNGETELKSVVDDLNIKVKNLKSVMSLTTKTEIKFKTIRKDSLIYIPGKDSLIKVECLEYKDAYVDFSGCYNLQDEFEANIIIPDSIIPVVHKVPHTFLFFRWGTKAVELDVVNVNPYVSVKCEKYIEFTKRR